MPFPNFFFYTFISSYQIKLNNEIDQNETFFSCRLVPAHPAWVYLSTLRPLVYLCFRHITLLLLQCTLWQTGVWQDRSQYRWVFQADRTRRRRAPGLYLSHPPPPSLSHQATAPPFCFPILQKNVATFGACVCVTIVIPSASLCVSVIACPLRSSAAIVVQWK